MSVNYTIDPERHLVVLAARGSTSTDDFVSALMRLARDPGWNPAYTRLWDWRAIEFHRVALRAIRASAQTAQEERLQCRRTAIVVTSRIGREVARAIKASVSTHEVEVFGAIEDAAAWLGVTLTEELRDGPAWR